MQLPSEESSQHPVKTGVARCACILLLILSVCLLCSGLNYHIRHTRYFYAVTVNGCELGLLSQEDLLEEMLDNLQEEAALYYGMPVVVVEEVNVEKVLRPWEEDNAEKVYSQLRQMLSYKIEARMVTVDGRDILPVATEKEVDKIIELLAGAYLPQKDNVSLEKVQIGEVISSRVCHVHPEKLCDVETLVSVLLRGTDRKEIYLVSRGDSLWKIARDYDLTVETLKEANPHISGDSINVGDEISLIRPEPLVNITTVERMVVEESIPFETRYTYDSNMWRQQSKVVEEGILGCKEVVYHVTRKNGAEISREKIQETVTEDPKDQVIARGTSDIPSRGSGSFIWPVKGGGRISSGYGWRNGSFHAGIDITSPKGTAILASDSGVVVSQGWDGAYGLSVVICHGRYYTRYAHNSKNVVTTGQAVNKGQVIAYMGSTGRSTGTHLHFEIRTGGKYGPSTNPLNFFSP